MSEIKKDTKKDGVIEAMNLTKCFFEQNDDNKSHKPEEVDTFVAECEQIIQYLDKIQNIKITQDKNDNSKKINVYRNDEITVKTSMYTNDILQRANNKDKNYIKVKKIL